MSAMMASFELLHILCFQTRDSVTPRLKQWVQLVVSSCGDHLPTESRLAAADVLTSTTPFFLTNPHPILGKCAEQGDVRCTKCAKSTKRYSRLKKKGRWKMTVSTIPLHLWNMRAVRKKNAAANASIFHIPWLGTFRTALVYSHPLSLYLSHFSPSAS